MINKKTVGVFTLAVCILTAQVSLVERLLRTAPCTSYMYPPTPTC